LSVNTSNVLCSQMKLDWTWWHLWLFKKWSVVERWDGHHQITNSLYIYI